LGFQNVAVGRINGDRINGIFLEENVRALLFKKKVSHTDRFESTIPFTKAHESAVQGRTVSVRPSLKIIYINTCIIIRDKCSLGNCNRVQFSEII
jgi:hypothetical protein